MLITFIFLHYLTEVAEELCRLFPVDSSIDMTPILRKSKEAARLQRAKAPEERRKAIPTSRPLSSQNRFGPPREGSGRVSARGGGGGGPPMRKRRMEESSYDARGGSSKYARMGPSRSRPMPYSSGPHGSGGSSDRRGAVSDRIRYPPQASRSSSGGGRYPPDSYGRPSDYHHGDSRSSSYHHHPSSSSSDPYAAASRSYYQAVRGYLPESSSSRPSGDRRYDRSVDDFLRRTSGGGGGDYPPPRPVGGSRSDGRDRSRYRERR